MYHRHTSVLIARPILLFRVLSVIYLDQERITLYCCLYSPSLESLPPPLGSITIADLFPEVVVLVTKSEVPPLQCSSVHLHLPLPLLSCHTPTQVVLKGLQEAIDAPQHLSWLILLTLYHYLQ